MHVQGGQGRRRKSPPASAGNTGERASPEAPARCLGCLNARGPMQHGAARGTTRLCTTPIMDVDWCVHRLHPPWHDTAVGLGEGAEESARHSIIASRCSSVGLFLGAPVGGPIQHEAVLRFGSAQHGAPVGVPRVIEAQIVHAAQSLRQNLRGGSGGWSRLFLALAIQVCH